jgi:hypothetical protein
MHVSRPAGPTEAEQEADWSFESATSGPAWQGWQPDSGQEGPEADFFKTEAGQLSDILGAHADFIAPLEPINEEQEEKLYIFLISDYFRCPPCWAGWYFCREYHDCPGRCSPLGIGLQLTE